MKNFQIVGLTPSFVALDFVIGIGLVVLAVLLLVGCHDNCEPDTTRCNGDRVEICNVETED